MIYKQEAIGKTLKATLTLGAREGYDGQKEYTLQEVIEKVNDAHTEIQRGGISPLNCMISESHLVGRSGDSSYQEKLFLLNFAWSPRAGEPNKNKFFETIKSYAFRLGDKMKQQRVYLEFDGSTLVFKRE